MAIEPHCRTTIARPDALGRALWRRSLLVFERCCWWEVLSLPLGLSPRLERRRASVILPLSRPNIIATWTLVNPTFSISRQTWFSSFQCSSRLLHTRGVRCNPCCHFPLRFPSFETYSSPPSISTSACIAPRSHVHYPQNQNPSPTLPHSTFLLLLHIHKQLQNHHNNTHHQRTWMPSTIAPKL